MKFLTKKRAGSAHIIVLAVLVLISVFSAFIVHQLQADIFQINAYSLQMQGYYLSDEAASAAVSALRADDDASLLKTGTFPMTDTFKHVFSGEQVGVSTITMTKETHPYYEEEKDWIVIRITTAIPDPRASRAGEDFTYQATVLVLVENPLIQLYNINPDEL